MCIGEGQVQAGLLTRGLEELAVVRLRPPPARCVPRLLLHDWKLAIHFASVLINAFATIKMCPIKRSMIMINVDAVVRRFFGRRAGNQKDYVYKWGVTNRFRLSCAEVPKRVKKCQPCFVALCVVQRNIMVPIFFNV